MSFLKKRCRLLSVFLLLTLTCELLLSSCAKNGTPHDLMREFAESYGISDTVFSPLVNEGEDGYTDEEFFEAVFGEGADSVSDYAIVFLSSLDVVGECCIFLCYSDYDALVACEILWRRVDLLKSMSTGMDISYTSDAVVFKSGKYAVMCALSDNAKAERIWKKIL